MLVGACVGMGRRAEGQWPSIRDDSEGQYIPIWVNMVLCQMGLNDKNGPTWRGDLRSS